MTDRRRASAPDGRPTEEPNPFAAPPEGTPVRTWSRRQSEDPNGSGGNGDGDGKDEKGRDGGDRGEGDSRRSPWGRQWSSRQPGRQSGGFGLTPQQREDGDRDREGRRAPRWDPSDPRQRHARYSLLAGGWAVFPALLGWDWLALFLAAFALYWGVSALRGARDELTAAEKSGTREGAAPSAPGATPAEPDTPTTPDTPAATGWAPQPAPGAPGQGGAGRTGGNGKRPMMTAAAFGVGLASLALGMVAANFTVQMVYQDYFVCARDALTIPSHEACDSLLPEVLHDVYIGER
ncbi:hypothetical protein [Streptomyces otsuchiensis]|uniref:hypothetical protein n=1 Tax=Streptomyces otsuchiensis TaxID=2681388 RepID=UPI001D1307C6|nr:hypothetical protein [Streptomyces otsuchiensis]